MKTNKFNHQIKYKVSIYEHLIIGVREIFSEVFDDKQVCYDYIYMICRDELGTQTSTFSLKFDKIKMYYKIEEVFEFKYEPIK